MVKRLIKRVKQRKEPIKHERITNETVAQHREKILAGGRKFKYPVQYARHRLIINTILISIAALIILVGVLWWQLYPAQNTSAFFYRITQLVPLPVASVDGQQVPYRDYLMEYRSSIYWLEKKTSGTPAGGGSGTGDSRAREIEHYKRQSLNRAIENAYAQKIANEQNIVVTDKSVDAFINKTLASQPRKISRQAYEAVLSDSYGFSPSEYKSNIKDELLRQEVSFKIDVKAKATVDKARKELLGGKNFTETALKYSQEPADVAPVKISKGDVGFVKKNNKDQGITQAASKLKKGETSGILKATDAYYIVKLTDTKDDQVRYSRIRIPLTEFDQRLSKVKKEGKVHEYINVKKN